MPGSTLPSAATKRRMLRRDAYGKCPTIHMTHVIDDDVEDRVDGISMQLLDVHYTFQKAYSPVLSMNPHFPFSSTAAKPSEKGCTFEKRGWTTIFPERSI